MALLPVSGASVRLADHDGQGVVVVQLQAHTSDSAFLLASSQAYRENLDKRIADHFSQAREQWLDMAPVARELRALERRLPALRQEQDDARAAEQKARTAYEHALERGSPAKTLLTLEEAERLAAAAARALAEMSTRVAEVGKRAAAELRKHIQAAGHQLRLQAAEEHKQLIAELGKPLLAAAADLAVLEQLRQLGVGMEIPSGPGEYMLPPPLGTYAELPAD